MFIIMLVVILRIVRILRIAFIMIIIINLPIFVWKSIHSLVKIGQTRSNKLIALLLIG